MELYEINRMLSEAVESMSEGVRLTRAPKYYINKNSSGTKWQIIHQGMPIAEKKTRKEILDSYKHLVSRTEKDPMFWTGEKWTPISKAKL